MNNINQTINEIKQLLNRYLSKKDKREKTKLIYQLKQQLLTELKKLINFKFGIKIHLTGQTIIIYATKQKNISILKKIVSKNKINLSVLNNTNYKIKKVLKQQLINNKKEIGCFYCLNTFNSVKAEMQCPVCLSNTLVNTIDKNLLNDLQLYQFGKLGKINQIIPIQLNSIEI